MCSASPGWWITCRDLNQVVLVPLEKVSGNTDQRGEEAFTTSIGPTGCIKHPPQLHKYKLVLHRHCIPVSVCTLGRYIYCDVLSEWLLTISILHVYFL